jgi:1-acyl-sn-glycerol-3-phosphate acyltransferase
VRFNFAYWLVWSLTRIISKLFFRIRTGGQENIPSKGGFILATNHISYYDPPLVGSWITRELYFFAKKELFKNRLFGAIIRATNALPVNRQGVDRQAIRLAVDAIERGFGLTMFPEGTRSRTDNFLSPKPGIGMIATRAGCPIAVGYIHGSSRPGDCFRGRDRLSITYGETFSSDWVKSFPAIKEGYYQIAEAVMERIEQLKAGVLSAERG